MIATHTDVVGSLLRPAELLDARGRHERGELDAAAFKAVEDRAVDAAVELQETAGIENVTDGEMRRLSFQSGLPDAVDGFGDVAARRLPVGRVARRRARRRSRHRAAARGWGCASRCGAAATSPPRSSPTCAPA